MTACQSSTAMTEENITKTVQKVEAALKNFDIEALEKYVSSPTLKYIVSFAKSKEQFSALGRTMFENLEIEVKSVNPVKHTVTLSVKNRDMGEIGANFANELTSQYSAFELLSKINEDAFLDASLDKLTAEISEAIVPDNPTEITVTIEKGKKNLILVFDDKAEDAVSGGALSAITKIVTG